jgi:sulfite exporter TauE/SafE
MSFGAKYQSKGNFFQANVKPHLLFHLGRLATFFILGGLLGAIGGWFDLSGPSMGWFTIFVAVILAWLGLNILGILPSLSSVGIRLPKKIMHLWNKVEKSEHALAPVVIGGLTFFLPCGFTQSMQIFAIASGSFMTGAWTLLLFALGTGPVLLGLGVATTRFKNKKSIVFKKTVGFLVIIFALYTLVTGFALAGINVNLPTGSNTDNIAEETGDVQIVEMKVDYSGFTPNVFRIKKGVPVKWIINGVKLSGCSSKIIVPDLGIEKQLSPGKNTVEFTPLKAGTLNFSCWMGMIRGKFIVE